MAVTFTALSPAIGVCANGIDSLSNLGDGDRKAIYDAFNAAGLILFRGLEVSPKEQIAFTSLFGEADIHPIEHIRMEGHPEIIELGAPTPRIADANAPHADDIMGRIRWHSDLTYTIAPSRGALLLARQVPPELGRTGFVDTAAVYDALPDEMKKKIEHLRAVHSITAVSSRVKEEYQEGKADDFAFPDFPPVIHPLIHTHPVNGRKVLNISPEFIRNIVGMSEAESDELIGWLSDFATQERFVYRHVWQQGDMLVWDNFRTMHSADGYRSKHVRLMHRTTLKPEGERGQLAA